MEESRTPHRASSTDDIATEPYKGPSARVAAAGQGFIDHFKYAFAGLFGAGLFAFVLHKPAAAIITKARNLGARLKDWSPEGNGIVSRGGDTLTNWAGGLLHIAFGDVEAAESMASLSTNRNHVHHEWLANVAHDKRQGFGNALLSHTVGLLPWVGKGFKQGLRHTNERLSTAITFGGAAGVVGYVTGWTKALLQGAKHGNAGKTQFESAQSEIKHQREKCGELERSKQELSEKLAAQQNTAKEERVVAPEPTVPVSKPMANAVDSAPSTAKLEAAEHKGMLAAERAAEPAMA